MSDVNVHFRPEEQSFVEKVNDWITASKGKYQSIVTPFLDPREREILFALVRREPMLDEPQVDGGYDSAERCRVLIRLDDMKYTPLSFGLAYLRLSTKDEVRLEHRDVLGALLGLGIKREVLGDCLPHAKGCDLVVQEEMVPYIQSQLDKVGRKSITITPISRQMLRKEEHRISRKISVSSLRIDTVLAEGHQVSRNKANLWIKQGKCKKNWKIIDQPHEQVREGNLLSLKGFGRFYVSRFYGRTKKGKIWVELEIIN